MRASVRVRDLLERRVAARRKQESADLAAAEVARVCAELRAFYYPKQRAFFTSKAKRRSTRKTRRAGATVGGVRELIARSLEVAGHRAVYVAETRIAARGRAWETDTDSGFADIVRKLGRSVEGAGTVETWEMAGVQIQVRQADLALVFGNGSKIELFGADDERSLNKQRGLAKHVYWIDEAQGFRWLERFYRAVIVNSCLDFGGEVWLTGTPDRDCAGMFFETTRDDGEPLLTGWECHQFAQVDNPFFGAVTQAGDRWWVVDNMQERHGPCSTIEVAEELAVKVRWGRTAEMARVENGWEPDDPDFLRECLARWVKTDANFVYAANQVPDHELTYAPVRLAEDGFPDIKAALLDLPGAKEHVPPDYTLVLGADLGTRDAFAFVVWAFSNKDPNLYEVCSWKMGGLDYDEMSAAMISIREQAVISIVVADAGGGGKGAVQGWSKKWVGRYGVPIIEATKSNKPVAIKQLNTDIRKRRIKLRRGSALLTEWRSHRWAPKRSASGMPQEAETENHAADAGLYGHRESWQYRFQEPEPQVAVGSPEYYERVERDIEQEMEHAFEPDQERDTYAEYH